MKKRLISLLLVMVMLCTLLPLSVMAEDSAAASPSSAENFMEAVKELLISDNRPKVTPQKPSGDTGMVVVPVFGKELTDVLEEGKLFDHTKEALQVRLSGKSIIPEVKITITGTEDKTKEIQQEELVLANYSVFNDIVARVGVKVQGRQAFKEVLIALKNHFQANIHTDLGRKALKDFFDAFHIPYEDDDIEAIIDNPSAFETNILNVIGRGEYTDANGRVHAFNKEILGFTFGFTGLGLTEEDCADVDSFFTALYSKYAGETVDTMITNAIQNIANDQLAQYAGFAYQVYVKENLPAGDYQVRVEIIDRQGFTTFSKGGAEPVREYPVTVKAADVSYAGETRSEGTTTIDFEKLFAIEDDELDQIENDSDNSLIKLFNFIVEAKDKLTELYNAVVKLAPNNKEITLPIIGKVSLPLVVDFALDFTGVWLDRQEPYIGFTNQDLGGNNIKKTVADEKSEFVMVDRDQLIKVMEAMKAVGKDTFTNAVTSLREIFRNESDIITWDAFVQMHKDLIKTKNADDGTAQVSFDASQLLPLLRVYVKMLDIPEVWDHFLAQDVRFPAILKAAADDAGNVRFSEDSNITLVWMLDTIIKIADLSQDALEELGQSLREEGTIEDVISAVFEGAELENEELKQLLVNVLVWVSENTEEGSKAVVEILKATVEPVKGLINEWVYPILQNDALFHLVGGFLEVEGGDGRMHGILTDKMPDSYYLLLQKKAPKGYLTNPMVYTVKLDWSEDGWVYAKIANLGIVWPYFAENYYTFLRNNSIAKTTDRMLSILSGGKYKTFVQDLMAGKADVTGQTIAASTYAIVFQSWIIYNFMGGRLVYSGANGLAALQADLTRYLMAQGKTAENLIEFGGVVYNRSKAVVTADLSGDSWAFYNASKSIKENIIVQAIAIAKQIRDRIETDGNKTNEMVKKVIDDTIEKLGKVDTTSRFAAYAEAAKEKAEETAKETAKSVLTTAIKKTTSLFIRLLKQR